jgi:CheY-like chemotaxis protein/signal transduction histidine kinase
VTGTHVQPCSPVEALNLLVTALDHLAVRRKHSFVLGNGLGVLIALRQYQAVTTRREAGSGDVTCRADDVASTGDDDWSSGAHDALIENSLVPLVALSPDGRFLLASRAGEADLTGASGGLPGLVGRHVREVLPAAVAERYTDAVADVCRTGQGRTIEYQLVTHTAMRQLLANLQPIRYQNAIVGVSVTSHDISQRKALDDALRTSGTRYKALFAHTPVPVVEMDMSESKAYMEQMTGGRDLERWLTTTPDAPLQIARRARWLSANQAAITLLGARDEQETLQAFTNAYTRETQEVIRGQVMAMLSGQAQVEVLSVVRTVTGELRDVISKVSIPPGHEATLSRVLLSLLDVTENLALKEQLARAERLAAMGRLAAGIGHEINNPLTYTYANLQLIQRQLAGAELPDLLRLANEALEGCGRVRKIVYNLRNFAAPRTDDVQDVDVIPVIEAAVRMCDHEVRCRARLTRDLQPVPTVRANAARLEQLVLNLLLNAAQSIDEGRADDHEIRIETKVAANGATEVAVSHSATPGRDAGFSGPNDGFDHDADDKDEFDHDAFDPVGLPSSPEAGGLLFYGCQIMVQALGGTIATNRRPQGGTTVVVRLPTPAAESARRGTVLVVDDEPANLRCLGGLLSDHHVVAARSGKEALEALDNHHFDVVFCDLFMPEMDGIAFYREALARQPELAERFVFMTGGAFTEQARGFLESVRPRQLNKPFEANELLDVVSQLVGGTR